jgi:hypothetical protein
VVAVAVRGQVLLEKILKLGQGCFFSDNREIGCVREKQRGKGEGEEQRTTANANAKLKKRQARVLT